ncbi:MAG: amidohydrolase [Pseudomonadales bacterium]|jgi:predicted amidohydrolase YtcJ|tara:strand:- start:28549 stop:30195 length:1647 start_codon:yes stop_codon:yes gene_type:complete
MITVFTAKKIITMNPSWPDGTAIAVREGLILEVGTLDTLAPWLAGKKLGVDYEIDDQFEQHVMMPGLIDPHLHPMMAAVLLPMKFITAMKWSFPWDVAPATTTPQAYEQALIDAAAESDASEPFFTWGYHSHWHGEMNRTLLDGIFGDRPAVVWQRSFHEVYLNSAMIKLLAMDEEKARSRPQIDIDAGHFYENGLGYAIRHLNSIIMSAEWIEKGLQRLGKVVHFGGQTTVGDMAVGLFDFDREWRNVEEILDIPQAPYRVICVPHVVAVNAMQGDPDKGLAFIDALQARSKPNFRFTNKVKLFTDGAFFSQLAMLSEPSYIDGHHGEWLTVPEDYESLARLYWQNGYQIHVHCTGDLGLELALDTLEKLQWERPRFNHGYTIEHFGFSTPEQVQRIKALGAQVSANVYYLHELSAAYSEKGVGIERSSQMARVGDCVRHDIRVAFHSDFPMAPAMPLHSAWVACTRENCDGKVVSPNERLSLDAALRAITIDAAATLGIEAETGSLRSGKKADFAIMDLDPYEVGAARLKEIQILATVFEGVVHKI